MKAIKGFDSDLKCRDFQYEIGKTYTMDGDIEVCERGFHAIPDDECPLNVFEYYPPSVDGKPSRYCEVEMSGKIMKDGGKAAASEIKIGAEIGIPGLVKAHVEWVRRHIIDDDEHKATASGDYSSASNMGDYSSASNTGYQSSASNMGDYSSASNTGDYSSASNTGNRSSAEVSGKDSVAIATGYKSKVKGALGCAIVVAEHGDWNGSTYPLLAIKAAIVDGVNIKPDTWYGLRDGEFFEVEE